MGVVERQAAGAQGLDAYRLDDRYRRAAGRVFLTGSQAIVAIALAQRRSDRARGLNTAGYVSGYRGSPLGGVDQAFWRAASFLAEEQITFAPAINEDLAATAVLGTQQVEVEADRTVDGVFGIWYGKGPGVDRAGDALRHGNAYGSSPHGGVLVIAGDDHGCASSSMSHQSDVAFMTWYMPTIHPAHVDEYVSFGLWGFAASRFSGLWIGFKAISEIVESGASVELPAAAAFRTPTDITPPPGGLNFRWPDLPGMQIERRMQEKKDAILAFARANPIDRAIYGVKGARYGIITTGKAHRDVMEALAYLGIEETKARAIGLDVYKVGMVWPLECEGAQRFMAGKEEILVIEEKRGIIESQLKEYLYDRPVEKPKRILGKYDETGAALISWVDELSPSTLAPIIAWRLLRHFPSLDFSAPLAEIARAQQTAAAPDGAKRLPYFCSGCPHNTSTRVPEGSKALAGIGCHFMASWMDRETTSLIQMGGEGVNWAAKSLYLKGRPHIFQNLGDGTYFHSGSMAIRQAIAAGANITFKILFNDAVAMTGGQPIDGVLTVPMLARQLQAEGVRRIEIVSDDPEKQDGSLPPGVGVHHRDALDEVQRALREVEGVSALIYEQECAAEKRRKRKRGERRDPPRRVFINELVCEGCGDCSVQSNCLSVVPIETEFGRKRRIDQSSCNKDYSCLKGFCPSFVTVEGGSLRKPQARVSADETLQRLVADLPEPTIPDIARSYDILVGGVGGTGVVTIGAVLAMAAHLEGKGASVLDFMGFAQKGGTVLSYVRLASRPAALNQVRIDAGRADAAIICDLVVGSDPRSLSTMGQGRTRAVASLDIQPTADFIRNRSLDFGAHARLKAIATACGEGRVDAIEAGSLAERLLGDLVFSNMFLLGYAWQKGLAPVSLAALRRAIELNGVAVGRNLEAFSLGRAAAIDPEAVRKAAGLAAAAPPAEEPFEALVARLEKHLSDYQNREYAESYSTFVRRVAARATPLAGGDRFARAVARNLFKLMAYKDEYEVARLFSDGRFREKLAAEFDGVEKLKFHLAPPLLAADLDEQGRPRKRVFGPWMADAFSLLRHFKFLRGTAFDPFGATEERRMERRLIADYRARIETLAAGLSAATLPVAIEIAELPDEIRGFGPVKLAAVETAERRLAELTKCLETPDNLANVA